MPKRKLVPLLHISRLLHCLMLRMNFQKKKIHLYTILQSQMLSNSFVLLGLCDHTKSLKVKLQAPVEKIKSEISLLVILMQNTDVKQHCTLAKSTLQNMKSMGSLTIPREASEPPFMPAGK